MSNRRFFLRGLAICAAWTALGCALVPYPRKGKGCGQCKYWRRLTFEGSGGNVGVIQELGICQNVVSRYSTEVVSMDHEKCAYFEQWKAQ